MPYPTPITPTHRGDADLFFQARTPREKEEIANDLLGGYGFDAEAWAPLLDDVEVDAVFRDELRTAARLWERGF